MLPAEPSGGQWREAAGWAALGLLPCCAVVGLWAAGHKTLEHLRLPALGESCKHSQTLVKRPVYNIERDTYLSQPTIQSQGKKRKQQPKVRNIPRRAKLGYLTNWYC